MNETMLGMHMHMWMFFHTEINDTVLFRFWNITTVQGMLVACSILFAAGFFNEFLKRCRASVDSHCASHCGAMTSARDAHSYDGKNCCERYCAALCSCAHLGATFLFVCQFLLGYLLMLAFMSFSIWIGASITAGATVGYYVFNVRENRGAKRLRYAAARHSVNTGGAIFAPVAFTSTYNLKSAKNEFSSRH